MKSISYLSGAIGAALALAACNKQVLDKNPLGTQTPDVYYSDSAQAILGINGIYDATSWEEGPNAGSNVEWMFGDILSNDAEKGSTQGDFNQIQLMKEWRANPADNPGRDAYNNMYQAIFRANTAIANLQGATWNSPLKTRLIGESRFLRGYAYFYLLRMFGGVTVVTTPLATDQFGQLQRSSFAATCQQIEQDLKYADSVLPVKSAYAAEDMGRATKGAAESFLARVYMYQLGTDNTNAHTWQQVYDITNTVMQSGQYNLLQNYAQIQELEGENGVESIYELQYSESQNEWGPGKVGTTSNVFQNTRSTWGWGFNNPTQSLVDEFEPNDPRKACTVYGNGDIACGIKQIINKGDDNFTGYMNRKAAIVKPAATKASGQNIRKMRYADILLMHAEAAAHIGREQEARDYVNQVRARARLSTLPKGSLLNDASTYANANTPAGTLPDIDGSVAGTDLLKAIWHERRVELGMEALHFWDMIRTGTYISSLPDDIKAACNKHLLPGNTVNPIPVLPIPLTEVQAWKLAQNPGY
ncbi:RagB/SusD family nutrient uptake outer membrane protein [Deminuibacter soli]|uniref:RagB/SusD family nutrient uptake outer membrane protein n=1 Tax=Deminuibacter soli TaxID=2291815 RepID=A0A3E1NF67_9BACT|nr:RagB/SusD family nutrient uptake outer membrane protein [Deminuibacter soli]RFM26623.1 RagB/SusD family nutrient uptake outer membrane protein [Deminuibacter soli]